MRGGKLYDARWGTRMRGEGPLAEQIKALFVVAKKKAGFHGESAGMNSTAELSAASFRVPSDQLSLFDE
jgi:hypothetical protein